VMRRKLGDQILLFNGTDGEWCGRLSSIDKKVATVILESKSRHQTSQPILWLLFAPIKRTLMDLVVQKATELGVTRLTPVMTVHTNVAQVKTDRLTKISTEAAEQSRRLCIPKLEPTISLPEVIADWPNDLPLFILDVTQRGKPIGEVLGSFANKAENGSALFIGPEGGFSESELDLLGALPFSRAVSLGPRILRAETAAIAALTCWQVLCGDWNGSNS